MERPKSPRKSIFITCQGTRGDVQPYQALGRALQESGWAVAVGAPAEFKAYIESAGLRFIDIGPAPTHTMYEKTVSDDANGARYNSSTIRPFAAYAQAKQLFNPRDAEPFTTTWFRRILAACRELKPDVLVLVFTSWCGAATIPTLLGHRTRVVISYPMPMAPTKEFGVAMAGTGYSLCCSVFNSWQWSLSERWIVQRIHRAAARRTLDIIIQEEAAAGRPLAGARKVTLDGSLNTSDATALFAYSPALLPKPLDWPQHYHVVGQLEHRQRGASFGMQTSGRGGACGPNALPGPLQEYLDRCRQNNLHVVYVGFGSLSFFDPGRVTEILDTVAEAIEQVAAVLPVRAVIQTTLSSTPGKTGAMSRAMTDGERPFFAFSEMVDHRQLFPQVSLIVSHGGIGTVQAALAAGKPVLSMCCLPTADQSFWADLVHRRRLGPQWFWVSELSAKTMATRITDGMENMELYTRNAEALAKAMALEDGVGQAVALLEKEAVAARAVAD
jgi:sterol 3beta-glucosyltransferase